MRVTGHDIAGCGAADDPVRREIVRAVVGGWTRYFDGLGFALLLAAVFCGYVFSVGSTPVRDAAIWLCCVVSWSFGAYALRLCYLDQADRFSAAAWEAIWAAAWFVQGLAWSSMAWWFFEPGNPANNALICIVILGMLVSNFYQLGASFLTLTASLAGIGAVTWSSFLWHAGEVAAVVSAVFPVFVVFLVTQAWGVAKNYSDVIAMRFANETLAADRDRALMAAEKASRAKSEFLANMSHELRTPLNAILGFSEIVEKALYGAHASPKYGEYAGHIRSAGQHLLSIVNDILDISKIEAGQMQVHPEWLDAPSMAKDAAALFHARAQAAGVEIVIASGDCRLFADRRAAHQILLNLLSNAVKYTPSGGRIRLSLREAGAAVVMTVEDTGCGIPPDVIPRLFEPFVQTDNSFERAKGGTGLGLALVRSLARLHGGDARLSSVLGKGTSVTVVFPGAQAGPKIAA